MPLGAVRGGDRLAIEQREIPLAQGVDRGRGQELAQQHVAVAGVARTQFGAIHGSQIRLPQGAEIARREGDRGAVRGDRGGRRGGF